MARRRSMNIKGGFRQPTVARKATGIIRSRMPRTSSMLKSVLKEAKKEVTIAGGMALLDKMAKDHKQPIGSNGLRVGPTKEKEYQEQKIDTRAVGAGTYSSCYYMYRPKATLKSPRQQYRQKTSILTQTTSSANEQKYVDIPVLHARPVLNNPDSNDKYTSLDIKTCFNNVLRAQTKYTGNDLVDTELTIPESNTTIHLESVTAEMLLTNGDNPSEVTIYDLVPQYDLGPSTYSNQSYAIGYMSPGWCYNQGLASESIELEDNLNAKDIGAKPSDSVTFSRTWTTIKKTKITMTSNSVHKHNLMVGINKSIPYQKMAQASSGGGSFGGYCPTLFITSRGLPTSSAQATATEINISCNMELRYSSNLNQSPQAIIYDSTT